ncbi:hypothetical protein NL676_000452 [Syzygium grande]|nr:hypothetical protein NL676_000452 [Syzygium grande]
MFILGCFFLGVDVLHGNFAGLKHVHFQESFNLSAVIDSPVAVVQSYHSGRRREQCRLWCPDMQIPGGLNGDERKCALLFSMWLQNLGIM